MHNEDEENMNFNIYYLNSTKVYEIKMMIDNIIQSGIKRERRDEKEASKKDGRSIGANLGNEYTPNINAEISSESIHKSRTSSNLIESLNVIHTKSTQLRDIIRKCKSFDNLNDCKEGDLLKIDNIKLQILDEATLRSILLLRRNALKGLSYEGFDVNNLISSMLQDYSYIFKGSFYNKKKKKDFVIIKIPMEIDNEFESKYDVSDILIGHLSLVGVYKKVVTEDFIKNNTFTFFSNLDSQQGIEPKVTPSSIVEDTNLKSNNESVETDDEITYHFIDTIALIQDIQFEQSPNEENEDEDFDEDIGLIEKILNFFRNLGGGK